MQPEVTLIINDELGHTRQVVVQSKRFTIGRTEENDLTIENSSLSRRHAVIENFDGVVQITDCGSQNGTEVNGTPVVTGVLHDGDVVALAGVCEITVAIGASLKESQSIAVTFPPARVPRPLGQLVPSSTQGVARNQLLPVDRTVSAAAGAASGLSVPVIAAAAVLVILVTGGLLLAVLRPWGEQRIRTDGPPVVDKGDNGHVQPTPDKANSLDSPVRSTNSQGVDDSSIMAERMEKAAVGVMRHISSDDKSYGFSDKALRDIARKVDHYRTSQSLAGSLREIQRSGAALGSLAREEGLEPGLLIYTVLAQTDGGRTGGEPVVVARGIISDLIALKATFGISDADSCLILVAAFKMGRGEKRSHPLLATIRRLAKNPFTQRNIWYLNDQGELDAQVYDFVVSFLALGVIAQDPHQFGVAADPLVF